MKYIYFVACLITYVSATAVDLQGFLTSTNDQCNCDNAILQILKVIGEQNKNLLQINFNLNALDQTLKNIDTTLVNQYDQLCKIDEQLNALIVNEKSITVILNQQTTILEQIYLALCKICEITEDLEEIAAEQSCILDNLKNVALVALDDCQGKSCRTKIGSRRRSEF